MTRLVRCVAGLTTPAAWRIGLLVALGIIPGIAPGIDLPMALAADDEAATARAQDPTAEARGLARSGKRTEALRLLEGHLGANPADTEARILYGTVLSWEGRYDEARSQLKRALAASPNNGDAVLALVNVELWSDRPEDAERVASAALAASPRDPSLLLALARAKKASGHLTEAESTLDTLLEIEPGNAEARSMRESLRQARRPWLAGVFYSYDWFNDDREEWKEAEFSLKRATPIGSVIGRFYWTEHFGAPDNLIELEAWPRLRPGTWAYLSAGYSPAENLVYTDYRAAAELYQSLGKGWEASIGYRRLWFDDTTINLDVVSLSKYLGKWFLTGRVYRHAGSSERSFGYHALARYYFRDGRDYFGVRYARGAFREQAGIEGAGGPGGGIESVLSHSNSLTAELYTSLGSRWKVWLSGGCSREDRAGRSDLRQCDAGAGLYFAF